MIDQQVTELHEKLGFTFLLIQIYISFAIKFSKREEKNFELQLQKIQQLQIGDVLLSMMHLEGSFQQLKSAPSSQLKLVVDSALDDLEISEKTILERHQIKKANLLKQLAGLQNSILEIEILIGSNDKKMSGPVQQSKLYYESLIQKLKSELQIAKVSRATKLQTMNELVNKSNQRIEELDKQIEFVDQIGFLISELSSDTEKIGIIFFEKKGQLKTTLGKILNQNYARKEMAMISPLVELQLKNNFNDLVQAKILLEMISELRKKLVQELNVVGGDEKLRYDSLKRDVNTLEQGIKSMEVQLNDAMINLEENQKLNDLLLANRVFLQDSDQRMHEEANYLREQINQYEKYIGKRLEDIQEEGKELMAVKRLLGHDNLKEFILTR